MKKITARFISVVLSLTLVMNLVQLISVIADSSTSTANIVDIQFSLSEYDKTYDNGINTYWKIVLTGDQDIGFGDSTYWQLNLQQYMGQSQSTEKDNWEEHNVLADSLRENIYINGISIAEGLATDPLSDAVSTRIQAGDSKYSSTKNKLTIYVRAESVGQLDNTYGLNDYTDFTFEITEGITLNGFAINPIKYKYRADSQLITVDDGTISVNSVDFKYNSDYKNSKYHLFNLNLSDKITDINDVSQSVLQENITINGKTLKQGLKDNSDSTIIYTGSADTDDADSLYIAVKADIDPYGIDPYSSVDVEDIADAIRPYYCYMREKDAAGVGCGDNSHHTGNSYVLSFNMADLNGRSIREEPSGIGTNFYNSHLCVYKPAEVNPYIIINGKSIAQWLEETGASEWKAVHVRAASETELQIVIPEENIFSFDPTKPFTITFAEGLTLNGIRVNARNFNCPGHDFSSNKEYDGAYFSKLKKWSPNINIEVKAGIALGEYTVNPIRYCFSPQTKRMVADDGSVEFISAALTEENSYVIGGAERGPVWVITLKTSPETDIEVADKNGFYWRKNLQQIMGDNQGDYYAEHNSQAVLLRNNIFINGVSVNTALNATNTCATLIETPDANTLIIRINKENDVYGIDLKKGFSLSLKSGLKLEDTHISPITYNYSEDGFKIEGALTEKDPNKAYINSATVTEGTLCKDNHNSDAWIIGIDFDKEIYDDTVADKGGANKDYYTSHLQSDSWLADNTSSYTELRRYILVNGKTLTDCYIDGAYNSWEEFVHISTDAQNKKRLTVSIPKNNSFNFDGAKDFEITILSGITLNGYELAEKTVSYSGGNAVVSDLSQAKKSEYSKATVLDASIEKINNGYCSNSNHQTDSQWVVKINFDKNLYASDIYSTLSGSNDYYRSHLQAEGWTATAGRESTPEEILNLISLNGKSLKNCYQECTSGIFSDVARFVHISANDAAGKSLTIAIPTDNPYGFDGAADFKISVGKDLKINGYTLNPFTVTYTAATNSISVTDYSNGIPSNITNVELLTEGEKTWVIELTTEQDITVTGNGATDLQFVAKQKTAERKALS